MGSVRLRRESEVEAEKRKAGGERGQRAREGERGRERERERREEIAGSLPRGNGSRAEERRPDSPPSRWAESAEERETGGPASSLILPPVFDRYG
eukprot:scaffold19060_cov33-Tisochrysis_lutea.AAC.3